MRNDVSGLVEIASSKREHHRNIVPGSRFLLDASGRLIMLNIDAGTVLRGRVAIFLRVRYLLVCPSVCSCSVIFASTLSALVFGFVNENARCYICISRVPAYLRGT